MKGVQQHLPVVICNDAEEAVAKGHVYRAPVKGVQIDKLVIVKNGTEGHNATVDLVMTDDDNNQYVCMLSANLLKTALAAF